jgi:hypothetical protein
MCQTELKLLNKVLKGLDEWRSKGFCRKVFKGPGRIGDYGSA